MAEYSIAKNVDDHLDVIKEFKLNIPRNRKEWRPPENYAIEFSKYHHSRRGNNDDAYAARVGAVIQTTDGVKWRAIAKARSTWRGRRKAYDVYTTILWARQI